MHIMDLCILF